MSRTVILLRSMLLLIGSLALCIASQAGAQENLEKGKTAAQLYADDCAIKADMTFCENSAFAVAIGSKADMTCCGAGGAATEAGSPGLPRTWDEIAPGHLVIASEGPGNGWWDAIVAEVNGDMLTLHWRDYPWQPNVVQHRSAVALIKPAQ
jgi:hypothetical protein